MGSSSPPQMKEEELYKTLEIGLTKINCECIAMNGDEKKSMIKITLEVVDELIKKMKEASKLFEWLYNRKTYVGSYFDGLRVKEATEFDIDVVLKLPLVYDKLKISRPEAHPGFAKINLSDAKLSGEKLTKHQNETDEIFKWTNEDGYLSHRKVLKWWESVFSKLQGLTALIVNDKEYKITALKKSGPAMTAHISGEGVEIDVDLVPVIEFNKTVNPPKPIRWKDQEGDWYIVPKPKDDDESLWRLSFPEQERKLINGLNNLKMVNRFLKRVRDVFEWRPLASYHIKSIFLWEAYIRKERNDGAFFNKNLGYLFSYFLGKLQLYLEQRTLPFFWDEEMNLFVNIKSATMEGYGGRIRNVRTQIDKFLQEKNHSELQKLMRSLFYSAKDCVSVNGNDTSSQADETFALVDLESISENNGKLIHFESISENKYNSSLPFFPFPESSGQSQLVSPLSDSQDSGISSTSNRSDSQSTHYLESVKEKIALEIEECKIRVQIANIDLETAKMNLRTAEKRYSKAILECNMMSKNVE